MPPILKDRDIQLDLICLLLGIVSALVAVWLIYEIQYQMGVN